MLPLQESKSSWKVGEIVKINFPTISQAHGKEATILSRSESNLRPGIRIYTVRLNDSSVMVYSFYEDQLEYDVFREMVRKACEL
jgi:hypothetical protein